MDWRSFALVALFAFGVWFSGKIGYLRGQSDCAKEIYLHLYKIWPEGFEGESLEMVLKLLEEEEQKGKK